MDQDELEETDLFLGDEDDEREKDAEDPLEMGFHEVDTDPIEPEQDF